MTAISVSPSIQDFSRLTLGPSDNQEVTLGGASSKEPLKTRGNFASRMVEIFRPQRAENQHRAVAEAFINAITSELRKEHDTNTAFHNSQKLPEYKQYQMLTNLRDQLSDQLGGQARLTGGDIKSVLEWLNTEVQYQVYAETMEAAEAVMGDLELAAEDNDRDFNVSRVFDKFDDVTPLDEDDIDSLKTFATAYKPTKASIDVYLDKKTGTFPELSDLIAGKKRAANTAGRLDEAQAWGDILQWSNSKNSEVQERIKALSGVAFKVDSILTHIQQRKDAPQKTFPPLAQPAVTGSMGEKSILRNKNELSPFDPHAVLVDDGTNDESHSIKKFKFTPGDMDKAKFSQIELSKVGPREIDFKARFSAGRAVKSFDENQAPNPDLEVQPDPAEPAATETLKPKPGDFV